MHAAVAEVLVGAAAVLAAMAEALAGMSGLQGAAQVSAVRALSG
jgi:hypothetical protein